MKGRFNTSRIRLSYSYTVQEICRLFGIHKNTVRDWFRKGLKKMDAQRPCLVHGEVLRTFLDERQRSRRKKCAPEEFYCFRCRVPRRAMGNLADIELRTQKTVMLTGLCEVCETPLRKVQSMQALPLIFRTFDIPRQQQAHIRTSLSPSLNCDLEKESQR